MPANNDFRKNMSSYQRFQYGVYQFADHFFGRKKLFSQREKFYGQLEEHMAKFGEGRFVPIERRKDLSIKEFKENYVYKGRPVVMEGAAKDWPCTKKWSLEYFKNLHGSDEIIYVGVVNNEYEYEITTLADVIDNMNAGGGKYYRFYPLLTRHPEHIKDFDVNWLEARKIKPSFSSVFQVFMGGKGSYTALHNAQLPNLFVQTYGVKKWKIFSNYYTPILDPLPVRNIYRNAPPKSKDAPFNPFEPDYDYPYHLYKYIDGFSVELNPGDVFYNPPYYWHAVQNETDSIGVGYRWFAPFHSFKLSPLHMTLDCCTTKPPIWKSFSLYKKDLNELFLAETNRLQEAKKKYAEQEERKRIARQGR